MSHLGRVVSVTREGLARVEIEVQPGSKREGVIGINEWRGTLVIATKSPPVDGVANASVLSILSEVFQINQSSIELAKGDKSRRKQIILHEIDEESVIEILSAKLEER